jgi:hypothetical protein
MRRAPTISVEMATRFASQCDGNVRWGTLQGLALQRNQGLGLQGNQALNVGFIGCEYKAPTSWSDLLAMMEEVQKTGTSPRAFSKWESSLWDRPGGVDPWSILALELSETIV